MIRLPVYYAPLGPDMRALPINHVWPRQGPILLSSELRLTIFGLTPPYAPLAEPLCHCPFGFQ